MQGLIKCLWEDSSGKRAECLAFYKPSPNAELANTPIKKKPYHGDAELLVTKQCIVCPLEDISGSSQH